MRGLLNVLAHQRRRQQAWSFTAARRQYFSLLRRVPGVGDGSVDPGVRLWLGLEVLSVTGGSTPGDMRVAVALAALFFLFLVLVVVTTATSMVTPITPIGMIGMPADCVAAVPYFEIVKPSISHVSSVCAMILLLTSRHPAARTAMVKSGLLRNGCFMVMTVAVSGRPARRK